MPQRPSRFLTPALAHEPQWATRRLRLVTSALEAAQQGGLYQAVQMLDLCCRRQVPAANDFLLRAEFLGRLGFARLASADIERAYAIDPAQTAIVTRHLAGLNEAGRVEEARRVALASVRVGSDLHIDAASCRWLAEHEDTSGVALLRSSRHSVTIVVIAAESEPVDLSLHFDHTLIRLICEPSRSHSLAFVLGAAAVIEVPWPDDTRTVSICGGAPLFWPRRHICRPFFSSVKPVPVPGNSRNAAARHAPLTIVIAVYDGYDETVACLSSVFAQAPAVSRRIVIIDDCGPDPRLRDYLASLQGRPGVKLLVNAFNIGFIGSVNRALSLYPDGDVLLLNADAVLPPGALQRLHTAAYSAADIGTVTPLSNNGEFTSIPVPFGPSRLPAHAEIVAIDKVVSGLPGDSTIDLPNGIGFCLYIRDACRQAVGLLDDVDFAEGYLEEVDFCLRAGAAGFRNVCALDVFVGHQGGRSFKGRRRDLVVRNKAVLQRRFPGIDTDSALHRVADGLRARRHDIQSELLQSRCFDGGPVVLVVTARDPGQKRNQEWEPGDKVAGARQVSLYVGAGSQPALTLNGPEGPAPFWLPLPCDESNGLDTVAAHLRPFEITRLIVENGEIPAWLLDLPRRLDLPHEIRLISPAWLADDRDHRSRRGRSQDILRARRRAFLTEALVVTSRSPTLLDLALAAGCPTIAHEALSLGSQPEAPTPIVPTAEPSLAIFIAPEEPGLVLRLQRLARLSLSGRRPLRMVVFGFAGETDQMTHTGLISFAEVVEPSLMGDLFALHGCVASLLLAGPSLPEDDLLNLAARAPGPLFVLDVHAGAALAHCRDDVIVAEHETDDDLLSLILRGLTSLADA